MVELTPQENHWLERPLGALHVWSDVFPDGRRIRDIDAELTTAYRHLLISPSSTFCDFEEVVYGADLILHLVDTAHREIQEGIRRAQEDGRDPHRTIARAQRWFRENAIRVILNRAPRNDQHNGADFYLALADNGVEFYATPLDALKYVKNRITALFQIPTKNHPLFNGNHEQFRSSVIARSGECPDHLIRENVSEIPEAEHEAELAFIDKFGNLRIRAKNQREFLDKIKARQQEGKIPVQIDGADVLEAIIGESLSTIPHRALGIYANVADGEIKREPGYLELNVRWAMGKGANSVPSSWDTFGKPALGSPVKIGKNSDIMPIENNDILKAQVT